MGDHESEKIESGTKEKESDHPIWVPPRLNWMAMSVEVWMFQRHSVKVGYTRCYTELFLQYPKRVELFLYNQLLHLLRTGEHMAFLRTSLLVMAVCLSFIVSPMPSLSIAVTEMSFEDLFHLTKQEAQQQFGAGIYNQLLQAVEDFNAVLKGRSPKHAKFDKEHPLPADGGTSYYRGEGYRLTIVKSLNDIVKDGKHINGYIYGPVISFEDGAMMGNFPTISFLTFFRTEDLKKVGDQRGK